MIQFWMDSPVALWKYARSQVSTFSDFHSPNIEHIIIHAHPRVWEGMTCLSFQRVIITRLRPHSRFFSCLNLICTTQVLSHIRLRAPSFLLAELVRKRVGIFRQFLLEKPENVIVVVGHSTFFKVWRTCSSTLSFLYLHHCAWVLQRQQTSRIYQRRQNPYGGFFCGMN